MRNIKSRKQQLTAPCLFRSYTTAPIYVHDCKSYHVFVLPIGEDYENLPECVICSGKIFRWN